MNTGNAVSVGIKRRSEYTDAHAARDHTHDTTANPAFGRETNVEREFSGAIVHTTRSKRGIDVFCKVCGEYLLARVRMNAVVRKNMCDSCQILAVCRNGAGIDFSEEIAKKVLSEKEIAIVIGLNSGEGSATAWGCDLTYDYVRINGDYRT